MRAVLRFRRPVACGLLLVLASGCYRWVAVPDVDPVAYIEQEEPGLVGLSVTEGDRTEQVRVSSPQVANDSLKGNFRLWDSEKASWAPQDIPGIPFAAIRGPLSVKKFNAVGTVGAVILVPLAAIAALFVASGGSHW